MTTNSTDQEPDTLWQRVGYGAATVFMIIVVGGFCLIMVSVAITPSVQCGEAMKPHTITYEEAQVGDSNAVAGRVAHNQWPLLSQAAKDKVSNDLIKHNNTTLANQANGNLEGVTIQVYEDCN